MTKSRSFREEKFSLVRKLLAGKRLVRLGERKEMAVA